METKKKILIVEDTVIISQNIRDYLLFDGFDVVCASNGIDALKACEMDSIDLVIVGDLSDNGFAIAELIHEIDESLPIICISHDEIPVSYRKHFVIHHRKPFNLGKLVPDIMKILLNVQKGKIL